MNNDNEKTPEELSEQPQATNPEGEMNDTQASDAPVEDAQAEEVTTDDGTTSAHSSYKLPKDKKLQLSGMYENWFLDYASYVILERAVPHIEDGLKPVQRRIMHVMKKSDNGHYAKVAGIVGDTMHYHPHGDAPSIRLWWLSVRRGCW